MDVRNHDGRGSPGYNSMVMYDKGDCRVLDNYPVSRESKIRITILIIVILIHVKPLDKP